MIPPPIYSISVPFAALIFVALFSRVAVANSFIIDTWLEEPNLAVSYIWNLYERRDSEYLEDWSEEALAAVDTYEFGVREALKLMEVSEKIDQQHDNDAWIKLYNVATNLPSGTDYPPHINIISMWGKEANKDYDDAINGHYYTTASGALDPEETWYAWHISPTCPVGVRKPGVGVWIAHVDRQCRTIYQERVTAEGTLEMRIGEGAPIYALVNKAPSDLDIVLGGEPVRNVRRVFYNAWINYPEPYPEGTAKVVWEIRDYAEQSLTVETIIANPETGEITSHEREVSPLDGAEPSPTPEVDPSPTPEATPSLTPEITPSPTPEAEPSLTPEATPSPTLETDPSPGATLSPTPEVTPDETPEVTPSPAQGPDQQHNFLPSVQS